MVASMDWQDAVTLEERIIRIFQEGKTDSEEFKALVRIFGKPKIDGFLRKYQERAGDSNYLTVSDRCDRFANRGD
jgi:hypothetical protein